MDFINLIIFPYLVAYIMAYTNHHYTISNLADDEEKHFTCEEYERSAQVLSYIKGPFKLKQAMFTALPTRTSIQPSTVPDIDPFIWFQNNIKNVLYGNNSVSERQRKKQVFRQDEKVANFLHQPDGKLFRAELIQNKSGVHLPMFELLHRGYCELKETKDYMQTAVNAFAIILYGNLEDIQRLSSEYVLRSARTISMMKIPREKLSAMWNVVKGERHTINIPYETLARFRPLLRYINGKELSRLNLTDPKILSYIGTHAELDRHQVGLIASKYISINTRWSEPRYLNLMNNLLCGVPMTFMRKIPENTYLQLSHQLFYHIHACDPLQRRFYLALMMRTQVLGKAYSWSASDVARLGLLLAEVSGPDLSSINPKAMTGITSQVMLTMAPQNLQHLTEAQLKYIGQKPLNILARKLKDYQDQMQIYENKAIILKAAVKLSIMLIVLALLL